VPGLVHQAKGGGPPAAWPALLGGICAALALPLGGRAGDRIGPRWPAATGLLVLAYATFLLRLTGPGTAGWCVALRGGLRGAGMGVALTALLTTILAGVRRGGENRAVTAVASLLRVPVAAGAALLVVMTTPPRPPVSRTLDIVPLQLPVAWAPLHAVLLGTAAAGALGALLALRLPTVPVDVRLDIGGIVAMLTGSRRRSISLVGLGTRTPPPAPAEPAAAPARRPRSAASPRARTTATRKPAAPRARTRAASGATRPPVPKRAKAPATSKAAPERPAGAAPRRRVKEPRPTA
jgi:hypothetical protein